MKAAFTASFLVSIVIGLESECLLLKDCSCVDKLKECKYFDFGGIRIDECRSLCDHYNETPGYCPNSKSPLECVLTLHTYCRENEMSGPQMEKDCVIPDGCSCVDSTTTTTTTAPMTTAKAIITECEDYPFGGTQQEYCKNLCSYYAGRSGACSDGSLTTLQCLLQLHPFCVENQFPAPSKFALAAEREVAAGESCLLTSKCHCADPLTECINYEFGGIRVDYCKAACQLYHDEPRHCPNGADTPLKCVLKLMDYCQPNWFPASPNPVSGCNMPEGCYCESEEATAVVVPSTAPADSVTECEVYPFGGLYADNCRSLCELYRVTPNYCAEGSLTTLECLLKLHPYCVKNMFPSN